MDALLEVARDDDPSLRGSSKGNKTHKMVTNPINKAIMNINELTYRYDDKIGEFTIGAPQSKIKNGKKGYPTIIKSGARTKNSVDISQKHQLTNNNSGKKYVH